MKDTLKARVYVATAGVATTVLAVYTLAAPYNHGH